MGFSPEIEGEGIFFDYLFGILGGLNGIQIQEGINTKKTRDKKIYTSARIIFYLFIKVNLLYSSSKKIVKFYFQKS